MVIGLRCVRSAPKQRFDVVRDWVWLARRYFQINEKSDQFCNKLVGSADHTTMGTKLAFRTTAESLTGRLQHQDVCTRSVEQTFERGLCTTDDCRQRADFRFGVAMRKVFRFGLVYRCLRDA